MFISGGQESIPAPRVLGAFVVVVVVGAGGGGRHGNAFTLQDIAYIIHFNFNGIQRRLMDCAIRYHHLYRAV